MNYKKALKNFEGEERYNDLDCSEYEVADYFCDNETNPENQLVNDGLEGNILEDGEIKEFHSDGVVCAENQAMDETPGGGDSGAEPELYDFYKTYVEVERGDLSRQRYAKLAVMAREGTEAEKKAAREEACFYMKGLVKQFLQSYTTYIRNDFSYAEDLEQEAYYNIIENLPLYDPDKGLPSTFFYLHIKSAMVTTTNRMKHSITASDATLQRKIKQIQSEYKKLDRVPELADYAIETGETMSKIRSMLRIMDNGPDTHLEAIEHFDQIIPGDSTGNSSFELPENQVVNKLLIEGVIKRMNELFSPDEIEIFLRNTINSESIPSIAASMGCTGANDKIRRLVQMIRHAAAYDTEIRRLCSHYIKGHVTNLNIVTILPLQGENENMDLLETVDL